MFSAMGPSSQLCSVFRRISRVSGRLRSFGGFFSTAEITHCTVAPLSKTSCRINPPSPHHPYCRFFSKYSSPRACLAFWNGTRYLQSQNPAGVASCSIVVFWSTCFRTDQKIPSAPMTAWNISSVPSSNTSSTLSPCWVMLDNFLLAC